jgi:predicted Kef-type K+ transport protein
VTFGLLALITTAGLAGPLLAALPRLGLPLVVGEIAAGVLLGRTGLGWIDAGEPTTAFLSEVGFAMLMFVVGTRLPLRAPGLRDSVRLVCTMRARHATVTRPGPRSPGPRRSRAARRR